MKEGHLLMSEKERLRSKVFDRVKHGQWSLMSVSKQLGTSYRQTCRSYKAFKEHGDLGLIHKNRGKPSNRAKPGWFKHKAMMLYEKHYPGFGPTLAAEKLEEEHGLVLDHETLRRWLLPAGLWHKSRKLRQHRQRRERRPHFGELVQMDGSPHRWFGSKRNCACLINMVDDATGTSLAVMAHEETTADCMRALMLWCKRYGVPRALYVDRKSVFITNREPTLEEQLAGQTPLTVFGTVCHKLGIGIIAANSPQAKGRVERSHGVYQDRFVKELCLKGITTVDQADAELTGGFTDNLNRKFAVKPADKQDFHQPLPKGINLENVFCFEHKRVLQNDWTVRYNNCILQVLKTNKPLPRPKQKILVREQLDRTLTLWDGNNQLKYKHISTPQRKAVMPHKQRRVSAAGITTHWISP